MRARSRPCGDNEQRAVNPLFYTDGYTSSLPGDSQMTSAHRLAACLFWAALLILPVTIRAEDDKATPKPATPEKTAEPAAPADSTTQGTLNVGGGQHIAYTAIAGTITVGSTDVQDAQLGPDGKPQPGSQLALSAPKEPADAPPVARMFYVAYFKKDAKPEERPITFFYNGGPGSSTVWLHMGSLGPKHVVTDGRHAPARRAVHDGRQSQFPARRERPGLYRHAGHGLRAADRQRRREGLLGRGRGRERVCALHRTLYYQVQPLELAQVHLWRELRHHALGRAGRSAGEQARSST